MSHARRTTEPSSHDDIAYVIGRQTDPIGSPDRRAAGRAASATPSGRRRRRVGGLRSAAPARSSSGCSASPAIAAGRPGRRAGRRARPGRPQLKKEIADAEGRRSPSSTRCRAGSRPRSPRRRHQLGRHQRRPGRGQDEDHPDDDPDQRSSRHTYDDLVAAARDARRRAGSPSSAQEQRQGRSSSLERKALLAGRIRSADDTDRTSLLETFLSSGTFTRPPDRDGLLPRCRDQDKALAQGRPGPGGPRASTTRRRHPRPTPTTSDSTTAAQKVELDQT